MQRSISSLGVAVSALVAYTALAAGTSGVAERFYPLVPPVFVTLLVVLRPFIAAPSITLASLQAGCDLRAIRLVDQIGPVRAPVLFIHAQGERLIPVERASRLFVAAVEPTMLWITDSGDHCSAWKERTEYLDRLLQFFRIF
jgi:fermentation-respiration switch protein FrsA (DUF1100 family)